MARRDRSRWPCKAKPLRTEGRIGDDQPHRAAGRVLALERLEERQLLAISSAGPFITDALKVNGTATAIQIVQGGVGEHVVAYADRTDELRSVPPELIGADYIQVAGDDAESNPYQLDVTLAERSDFYVLWDDRAPRASWLGDGSVGVKFTDTGRNVDLDALGDGTIDATYSLLLAPDTVAGTYSLLEQGSVGTNTFLVAATVGDPQAVPLATFGTSRVAGTVESDDLPEISGMVASRQNVGILWAHNDSGDPSARVMAMNTAGEHLGIYNFQGIGNPNDWEDIAIGPGPDAGVDYLYVGATGDNASQRNNIQVIRVPEPTGINPNQNPVNTAITGAQSFTYTYPAGHGARDAETLLVDPWTSDVFIVTKRQSTGGFGGESFPEARLYRAAAPLTGGVLEYMGDLVGTDYAVGGDISPTGLEIIIKNYTAISYYYRPLGMSVAEALVGVTPYRLPYTPGPKDESLTFDAVGSGYFTNSEGNFPPLHYYPREAGVVPVEQAGLQNGALPAVGYTGGRDTVLAESQENVNLGTETTLTVTGDEGGSGDDLSALFAWQLSGIPAGSMIQSVALTLDVTDATSGAGYDLFAVTRPWDETAATWNNAAAADPWQSPGAAGAADRGTDLLGTVAPTVTGRHVATLNAAGVAVVQQWLDDPSTNHGLILAGSDNTDELIVSSGEAADWRDRPKLTIGYLPPDLDAPTAGVSAPPDGGRLDRNPADDQLTIHPPPRLEIQLTDRRIDDASVVASTLDVMLDGAPFTDYTFNYDAYFDRITLTPLAPEQKFAPGDYQITLGGPPSTILDAAGNAMPPATLAVLVSQNLTTPLVNNAPAGSQVYQQSAAGTIQSAGDGMTFAIRVDSVATLAAVVTPTGDALQPTIRVLGPLGFTAGPFAAAGPGQPVAMPVIPNVDSGLYRLVVESAGGTVGDFDLRVVSGAVIEQESYGGAANNDRTTPQNIDASFIELIGTGGATRGAVVGDTGRFGGFYQSQSQTNNLFTPAPVSFDFDVDVIDVNAAGEGILVFSASADLEAVQNFVSVFVDGEYAGDLFREGARDYPGSNADVDLLRLSREQIARYAADGTISVLVLASENVDNSGTEQLTVELAISPLTQTQTDNLFSPNVLTFDFPVASVPTGEGFLVLSAIGDLDETGETVQISAEGINLGSALGAGALNFPERPDVALVRLSSSQLQTLAADGTITITVTPSAAVEPPADGGTLLTLDLFIPVTQQPGEDYYSFSLDAAEVASVALSASYESLVRADQPVGYWRFEDAVVADGQTAAEATGRHHGIYRNGVSARQGLPRTGGDALALDGTSGYVELGNPAALQITGEITLEAWVQINSLTGLRNVIAKGYTTDPNAGVFMRIFGNEYQVGSFAAGDATAEALVPAEDVGTGKWTHLVGIYNGRSWELYRDGLLMDVSSTTTQGAVPVGAPWAIGARGNGSERFFDGAIDEAAIYDRALSPQAIEDHYLAAAAGFGPSPLVIMDTDGNVLRSAAVDRDNVNDLVSTFLAPQTGDYVIRVASDRPLDYTLVVTRGALFEVEPNNGTGLSAQGITLSGIVVGAIERGDVAGDYYRFSVNDADVLSIAAGLPGGGPLEPVNLLDPAIELYGPGGGLLVSRNDAVAEQFDYPGVGDPALVEGTYTVRVLSSNGAGGDYVLRVAGFTGEPPEIEVVGIDPPVGALLEQRPTQVTVNFSEPIEPGSLDAGDLTIDGVPATSVVPLDGDTAVFTIPAVLAGTFEVGVPAGAVSNALGGMNAAFTSTFTVPADAVPPAGGLIHRAGSRGTLVSAAATADLLLKLDEQQTLSIVVRPEGAWQAQAELIPPAGPPITVSSAIPGGAAVLQEISVAEAGLYRLRVSGVAGTFGNFNVEAVIGAAVELEEYGGAANGTPATAQDLDGSFTTIGVSGRRAAVFGKTDSNFYSAQLTQNNNVYEPNVLQFSFTGAIPPSGGGTLTLNAIADLGNNQEFLAVQAEGIGLGDVFQFTGNDYPNTPDVVTINLSQAQLTTLAADGTITITVTPSAEVDNQNGSESLTVELTYPGGASAGDFYRFSLDAGDVASVELTALYEQNVLASGPAGYWRFDDADSSPGNPAADTAADNDGVYQNGVAQVPGLPGINGAGIHLDGTNDFVALGDPNDLDITGQITLEAWVQVEQLGGLQNIIAKGHTTSPNGEIFLRINGGFYEAGSLDGPTVAASVSIPPADVGTGKWTHLVGLYNGARWEIHRDGVLAGNSPDTGQGAVPVNEDWAIGARGTGTERFFQGSIDEVAIYDLALSPVRIAAHYGAGTGTFPDTPLLLRNSGGTVLAAGSTSTANAGQAILDFVAPATGPYTIEIPEGARVDYSLIITRGASLDAEPNNALAPAAQDLGLTGTVLGAITPVDVSGDYYSVNFAAGAPLTISTATPGGGPLAPINDLDPLVELYDPNGQLLAGDDNSLDGRNAVLAANSTIAGTYTIRARGAGGTTGDYVLIVTGHVASPSVPYVVTSTDPPDGSPSPYEGTLDINFSHQIFMPGGAAASVVSIDSVPLSGGVELIDGDTLRFDLPAISDGVHTVTLAAGALTDVRGEPLTAYSGQIELDGTAPRIIASSIDEGAILPAGSLSVAVIFDENLRAAQIDAGDMLLVDQANPAGYAPDSFTTGYNISTGEFTLTVNYGSLAEGNYTFTLVSGNYAFEDLVGNDLDGEPGTLPTGDGSEGGDFVLHFSLDADSLPVNPFVRTEPFGSRLFVSSGNTGQINSPGDTDIFTLAAVPGDTLLAIAAPDDPTATLTLEIVGQPGSAVSASAPGAPVYLPARRIPAGGAIALRVGGDVPGANYFLDVVRNGVLEPELLGGAANDDSASAINLDDFFLAGADGLIDSSVVFGSLLGQVFAIEGFEEGSLGPQWQTSSSNGNGRIRILSNPSPAVGSFALFMDRSGFGGGGGGNVRNEAILTVDLLGQTNVALSFFHAEYGDETHNFPGDYTGSVNADGVSISDDGFNWHPILSAPNQADGQWVQYSFDLAAEAAAAGMTLGANFRIKFQQYDNAGLTFDGRGWDEIVLSVPGSDDWYRFDLDDGESITLALDTLGQSGANLDLLDAAQNPLASGSPLSTYGQVIHNYVDATSNGAADTYYARLTGNTADYRLVTTRNASFDFEPNDTLANRQFLAGASRVVGFLNTPQLDLYSVNLTAGETVILTTRSVQDTAGTPPVNNLDPRLSILSAAGQTLVADDNSRDGRHPLIEYTPTTSGEFLILVATSSGTGEYLLERLPGDVDFGDAPAGYPTLAADGGARHATATPALRLGAEVDYETDGQPHATAAADNHDDGVLFAGPLTPGGTAQVQVTAGQSGGLLNAWVDLNGNGAWDHPAELVLADVPLAAGVNPLSFPVPAGAALGQTFARFRLSTTGGLLPTGLAADGEVEDYAVTITATSTSVVGRHLFYNNSRFDDPARGGSDHDAIATDKVALLPGETAGFANYSSYDRGINGLLIDVSGLGPGSLDDDDFLFRVGDGTGDPRTWSTAPAPASVDVIRGGGAGGSDRIRVLWPDGAIRNTWLQVSLLDGSATGLADDDVFYFGSAVGDSGLGNLANVVLVDARDRAAAAQNPRTVSNPAPVDFDFDYNRDGLVNAVDRTIALSNPANAAGGLILFTALGASPAPAVQPAAAASVDAPPVSAQRAARVRVRDEVFDRLERAAAGRRAAIAPATTSPPEAGGLGRLQAATVDAVLDEASEAIVLR